MQINLLKTFKYCFKKISVYPPILQLNSLKKLNNFGNKKNKLEIRNILVEHGNEICSAFVINSKCAYISDVNKIYSKDYKFFKKLKYLVIDCLRYNKHPSHFNLDDVLNIVKIFKPKKTYLTNLHSDFDYNLLKKQLPINVLPAFDGLTLNL